MTAIVVCTVLHCSASLLVVPKVNHQGLNYIFIDSFHKIFRTWCFDKMILIHSHANQRMVAEHQQKGEQLLTYPGLCQISKRKRRFFELDFTFQMLEYLN